ncbi:SDR family oxidoreductase [Cyclobacteriaceae bacterium]|nr:SDR family oxidoreductase [Cyclobacteriaceae bacterium]
MAYNLLKGKKGIIFGALDSESIAWKVAEEVHEEGGEFILSNAPIAMRMGAINALAEKTGAEIIPADATSVEDLEKLVSAAKEKFGGIDFILHSIGMSPNIRKKIPYEDLNYRFYQQSLDVSALSFHKVMHVANKLDAINDYASIVAYSYIAAQRVFPDYTDMAQAKAMLESIARSFGSVLGKSKRARVNTISQSPTITTAGKGIEGFKEFFKFADDMSPLGNASAEDCAKYTVSLFSDLTRSVTMQNLMHDGGFSASGITAEIIEQIKVD